MRCTSCGHENVTMRDTCEICDEVLVEGQLADAEGVLIEAVRNEPLSLLEPAPAATVAPTATVGEVITLLSTRNIGCVLIVDHEQLVGIFSERDALLRIGANYTSFAAESIVRFMTPAPVTLTPEDSIAFALNRMDVNGFRHIPIRRPGGGFGIISVRDVLAYFARHFPELHVQPN